MARTALLSKMIIELLGQQHLLTVSEMLEAFSRNGKNYNKTSVYRSLEKLLEQKKVCKHNFGESEACYELRNNHHDHAICTRCKKLLSVECLNHEIKKIPGFNIHHHHLVVYGLCDGCNLLSKSEKIKRLS